MSDEEINVKITGEASGATGALEDTAAAARRSVGDIQDSMSGLKESTAGIGESLEELRQNFQTAFEFTGLAAAYEGIKALGEGIEELGARATQIRTMSEVLGLTTTQFQTLEVASEEAGVSIEMTSRSTERLSIMLNDARAGIGSAVEKLHDLGITNEQIQSSTFGINDLLGALHDRLNDVGTASSTAAALQKELGARAAAVVEALKGYVAGADEQKIKMAEVNGLSDDQIQRLHGMATWWKEVGTWAENAAAKTVLAGQAMMQMQHPGADAAGGALFGIQPAQSGGGGAAGATDAAQEAAAQTKQYSAQIQTDWNSASNSIQLADLQNIKASAEAFKQGTAERLTALRAYAQEALEYYGSKNVKEVQDANAAVLAAQRAYGDEYKRVVLDLTNYATDENEKIATDRTRMATKLDQIDAEQAKTEKKQADDFYSSWTSTYTKITKEHAQAIEEMIALNAKQEKSWMDMANRMSSAFASTVTGLLNGTRSWSSVAQSAENAILQNTIKNVTQGVTHHLAAEAAKAAAAKAGSTLQIATATDAAQETVAQSAWASLKKIANDAESAASGAFQAVVGIPYVGPILAPIAAATAFGAVLAFEGGIASASQGFDIPSGVNPVTQLHEEEMVLPKGIANPLRDMIAGGGSQAGGDTHFHITAMDAKSFSSFLHQPRQRATVASALREHVATGGG